MLDPIRKNNGFVLITSLIFLVVITLLAVSAMNATSLQEKMAANMREQSRAQQIANATLRHAEWLLEDKAFVDSPGTGFVLLQGSEPDPDDGYVYPTKITVWPRDALCDSTTAGGTDIAECFLDPTLWDPSKNDIVVPETFTLYKDSDETVEADFFVEQYKCINDCDTVVYRITARARGKDDTSIAVVQSFYLIE